MNNQYNILFQNFTFRSGITVNNRISMAPMTTWSGQEDGSVSEAELTYYQTRAKGLGMVITAAAYVMPEGKGFPGQIGTHTDAMIPSLKRLATTIQGQGAKAVLQIHHGGRMSPPEVVPNQQPVSASAVAAARPNAPVPRELSEKEIVATITAFGDATRRAIEAGFDGVEIHGANTYLVQQFFSPHSNRRQDSWGGSVEKRMTFPLALVDEIIGKVRQYAKRPFLVGYRFSPEEIENPGITMTDTFQLVDALANKPLDYLHVSTNDFWAGSLRDKSDIRSRILLIQERVGKQIPVMGVGSIRTAAEALKVLQTGVPLLAIGRELLMEPDWVHKVQHGEENSIRTTLSRKDQQILRLPDGLWKMLMTIEGWLPVVP
jgi:2,4-dienoyl-CoA reductase-like NADH-dependent reductase (Old Yellow Enzyme family)